MTYIPADLRRLVYERAGNRCEYCLVPDGFSFMAHEIDHIRAEKHDGQTVESNLCLSCWICNRHKGSDLTSFDPETEQLTLLFNPRKDQWKDHFQLADVMIMPLTPEARTTIKLLQLNTEKRLNERRLLLERGQYS